MNIQTIARLAVTIGVLQTSAAHAVEFTESVVVVGSQCIGYDCANNPSQVPVLELKQNSTRVKFWNTSLPATADLSWQLVANESNKGGIEKFSVSFDGFQTTTPLLSNGSQIKFDCPGNPGIPVSPPEHIPVGEQVIGSDCTVTMTTLNFTNDYLAFLPDGSTMIGLGSEKSLGNVSVGKTDLTRRLTHLAAAATGTGALIKSQMDGYSPYASSQSQLTEIGNSLSRLEADTRALEQAVDEQNANKRGSGGSGSAGFVLVGLLAAGAFAKRTSLQI